MNTTRTEPRLHCWQRPLAGAYVTAANSTPAHLAAVFAAERERIAQVARPRRRAKPRTVAVPEQPDQAQLQLVA